jgi:hypothetical protein
VLGALGDSVHDADGDETQAHLQPLQAVTVLNERVKRFNKLNVEIADWLQVWWTPERPWSCSC